MAMANCRLEQVQIVGRGRSRVGEGATSVAEHLVVEDVWIGLLVTTVPGGGRLLVVLAGAAVVLSVILVRGQGEISGIGRAWA